ncbi:MAG: polyprenol monophosphomannose synthase [Acidimicrobiales bacterium]
MRTLVVLPTYNEVLNIEPMVRALRRIVPEATILVVDDSSPDGTAARARELGAAVGQVEVLERPAKAGLGGAYRAGFAWGLERGYELLVEIDCDFSHDPEMLPTLLHEARTFDVVIGSRYVVGGSTPRWSVPRLLLSRGGNWYASVMLGLRVHDATAGYRVYRAEALEQMDYESVRADGYGFQIEMTFRARRAGLSISEVPIAFTDRTRGESKMSGAIVGEALWLVTRWSLGRLRRSHAVAEQGRQHT